MSQYKKSQTLRLVNLEWILQKSEGSNITVAGLLIK